MIWPIFELKDAPPGTINVASTRKKLEGKENPLGLLMADLALEFNFDQVFRRQDVDQAIAAQIEVYRVRAATGRMPESLDSLGEIALQPSTGRPFDYDSSNGRLRLSQGRDIEL